MYNNMDELISKWEEKINKLSDHIEELQSHISYYQNLLDQKEELISRLTTENTMLKNQIMNIQSQQKQPSYSSGPNKDGKTSMLINPEYVLSQDSSNLRKRQCPYCGAQGFAIKEMDDKTKIISYVPRRIYAKKRVCTKCRQEF